MADSICALPASRASTTGKPISCNKPEIARAYLVGLTSGPIA